jgi:hypothetical protein
MHASICESDSTCFAQQHQLAGAVKLSAAQRVVLLCAHCQLHASYAVCNVTLVCFSVTLLQQLLQFLISATATGSMSTA